MRVLDTLCQSSLMVLSMTRPRSSARTALLIIVCGLGLRVQRDPAPSMGNIIMALSMTRPRSSAGAQGVSPFLFCISEYLCLSTSLLLTLQREIMYM